jgi:hypothetical protein
MKPWRLPELLRMATRRLGMDVSVLPEGPTRNRYPADFDAEIVEIIDSVRSRTMTSPERLQALCDTVGYLVQNRVPGAFVECGVWRGGSAMAMALKLIRLDSPSRDLYLFDTFKGMTTPAPHDVDIRGRSAQSRIKAKRSTGPWLEAPLDDVQNGMRSTGYPEEFIHYVVGPVEETIPEQSPQEIALLRLDTDWYHSTSHELRFLYPRLSPGAVVIVDDYGHWRGARQAVDEYVQTLEFRPLLVRVDYTCRLFVVPKQSGNTSPVIGSPEEGSRTLKDSAS